MLIEIDFIIKVIFKKEVKKKILFIMIINFSKAQRNEMTVIIT